MRSASLFSQLGNTSSAAGFEAMYRMRWHNPNRLLIAAIVRAREMGASPVSTSDWA
jgi:hypothetical protein